MKKNVIKNKYIIISIIIILVLLITGTLAWNNLQSKKTAMVFTIGSLDNTQISLFPYELDITTSPVLTYTGMSDYVSLTATNSTNNISGYDLYYEISGIDNSLISSDMKYVITKSTDGVNFTEYLTGNFSTASSNSDLYILNNEIISPLSTVYYRVYTYLDGNSVNQSSMQGKELNANMMAEIKDINIEYSFDYTGDVQTFTAPMTGTYKLEVWGAQGGGANGGYGGYSVGNVSLTQGDILYIYVGGQGKTFAWELASGPAQSNASNAGGYNGGGSSGIYINYNNYYSNCTMGTGGGGATHIAKVSGLLSKLSNNVSDILIVAGGGGGLTSSGSSVRGASGGGYIGENGLVVNSSYSLPTGGSQTSGGVNNNTDESYRGGSFGTAARGTFSNRYGGGGGGGYYGGAAGCGNSGAGGSGYIGNSILSSKYMYCYNCTTSSDTGTLTYTTSNVSATATSNYVKTGNGYAKISVQ